MSDPNPSPQPQPPHKARNARDVMAWLSHAATFAVRVAQLAMMLFGDPGA